MASDTAPQRPESTTEKSGQAARRPAEKVIAYGDYIETQIRRTRQQVKWVEVSLSGLLLAIGVLIYLLAFALVDHWIVPGGVGRGTRLVFFAGLVLGAGYYCLRYLLPLVVRKVNPLYAAQAVEQTQPTLKNSVINFLMFRGEPQQVHAAVYRAMERRAAVDLHRLPVEGAIDRSRVIRAGYILLAIVALACFYTLLSPKNPLRSVGRLIAPWADVAPPTRVTIGDLQPGTVQAFHGDVIDVSAVVQGLDHNEPVRLYYTTADGQAVERPVEMQLPEGSFRHRIALPPGGSGLKQSLEYYVAAGDARSATHRIEVITAPAILVKQIRLEYPSYTGLGSRVIDHQGDLQGIEGTQVHIHAEANEPIRMAWIDLASDGRRDMEMQSSERTARGLLTLRLNRDRTGPEHENYQLLFESADGESNRSPIRHRIDVTADLEPEVRFTSPARDGVEVPVNAPLPLVVAAQDRDFRLAAVSLHVTRGASGEVLLRQPLLDSPRERVEAEYPLRPSELGLRPGDRVTYWAEARDNKQPTANRSETVKYTLLVTEAVENPDEVFPPPPRTEFEITEQESPPVAEQTPPDAAANQDAELQREAMEPESGRTDGESTTAEEGEQPAASEDAESAEAFKKILEHARRQQEEAGEQPRSDQSQSGEQSSDAAEQPVGGSQQEQHKQPPEQPQPSQPASSDEGGQSGDQQSGQQAGDQQGDQQQGAGQQQDQQQGQQQGGDSGGEQPSDSQQQQQGAASGGSQGEQPSGEGSQGAAGSGGQPSAHDPGAADSQAGAGGPESGGQNPGDPQSGDQAASQGNTGERSAAESPHTGDPERIQGNPTDPGAPGRQEQSRGDQGNQQEGTAPVSDQPSGPGEQTRSGDSTESTPGESPAQGDAETNAAGEPKREFGSREDEFAQPAGQQEQSKQQGGSSEAGEQQPSARGEADDRTGEGRGNKVAGDAGASDQENPRAAGESQQQGGDSDHQKGEAGRGESTGQETPSPPQHDGTKKIDKAADNGQQEDQQSPEEANSPATNDRETDTEGGEAGEQSGGGKEGGGQRANQQGAGAAGNNTAADQGNSQAPGQGTGEVGSQSGEQAPSDQGTNNPGDKQRSGSPNAQSRPGEGSAGGDGGKSGGGDMAGAGQAGQGSHSANNPGSGSSGGDAPPDDTTQGKFAGGRAGDGTSKPQETPTEEQLTPDAANRQYAEEATELALQHLRDQLARNKVDEQLLRDLNWSREDMEKFVARWERLKQTAQTPGTEGQRAREELNRALDQLGLRPRGGQVQAGETPQDRSRRLLESQRTRPPREYQELYEEWSKSTSRARGDK